MVESATTITTIGTHGYDVGDSIWLQTRRNGFWIRLWYIVFFGYVPMANKRFIVTLVDSGTTMSLGCVLT